ncbi:MAG: hypothetical protein C0601_07630 [Candidatus Muiribacterium halophilum]|uniref:Sporulation stage II protein D amidase enhancer LytB N-terminal domain-containing protein n=1 Tax=Muiribacterium halophilum TaxID=2053465 RepID=A0A2N5ZFM4_MUIH1|nr:MAG: hypothetical protein C0601_07630 [Candidatus Muirbacterium halophilum]
MRSKYISVIFILFLIIQCFSKTPDIRIGIDIDQKSVVLESERGLIIKTASDREVVREKSIEFETTRTGFLINSNIDMRGDTLDIYPVSGMIRYDKKTFRGRFLLYKRSNKINVINVLSMKYYLYGVIGKELLTSSPFESMKTLSVVCRTYALKNRNKHGSQGFDLCNTTHCQVYDGYDAETQQIRDAVDSTEGLIIKYDDELISAYHFSACGGATANNEDVWEGGDAVPYLRGRWCEFCKESPRANWEYDLKLSRLSRLMKDQNIGRIIRISKEGSDAYGRVKTIRLTGTNGEKVVKGNFFRLRVGAGSMWSMNFDLVPYGGQSDKIQEKIEKLSELLPGRKKDMIKKIVIENEEKRNNIEYEGYKIKGHGSGHGVGMCQWGAIGLSKQGFKFKDIIKFYYTGVEVVKEY